MPAVRGFNVSNLRRMRGFYLAFPIRDAARRELSWTHHRTLLRVDSDTARVWYIGRRIVSAQDCVGIEVALKDAGLYRRDVAKQAGCSERLRKESANRPYTALACWCA
nr:DUF1016 N-terminal domain-containing protein [Massilia antarctica]